MFAHHTLNIPVGKTWVADGRCTGQPAACDDPFPVAKSEIFRMFPEQLLPCRIPRLPRRKTDKQFCVKFIGDLSPLPDLLREKCIEVENMAKDKPFVCNVALNYGGRAEIVHAANTAIASGETEITEQILSKYMYTAKSPDPDLIIRTGGDFRVSNFLLWQNAYSEFVVLDTLWPDFDDNEIMKAVKAFYKRKRRFGGLDKEENK